MACAQTLPFARPLWFCFISSPHLSPRELLVQGATGYRCPRIPAQPGDGGQPPKGICQHNCLQTPLRNQMQQGRGKEKKKPKTTTKKKKPQKEKKSLPWLGICAARVPSGVGAGGEEAAAGLGAIWHPRSPQTVWVLS